MALPRAFISFDFDHDLASKILFAGQAATSSPTPFAIADHSSKEALPQWQWEALIKDKINQCNLMIVLVGRHMSTAIGVHKEIQFARECNVPYFGVYVDNAGATSPLPPGLPRTAVYTWTWGNVAEGIQQCMRLGKNR